MNKVRVILDTEYLTPEQIREAVIRLEKPITNEGTVINCETIKKGIEWLSKYDNPFYCCDSVGTEELHEAN